MNSLGIFFTLPLSRNTQNLVEEEGDDTTGSGLQDLRLQHNELHTLEGSLFVGMKGLQRLNLSHNALGPAIQLQDLRGLESLRVLDLSHNELTTLEDTSEVKPSAVAAARLSNIAGYTAQLTAR